MKGVKMDRQNALRVLIVEDEILVGEMLYGIMEEAGYKVVGEATDGLMAVEMTQSLQPDLVVMDIQMPNMNGIEATRRIQETCPTPVVVLTAHETPELVAQVSAAGAGAYLVKPPRRRELERAITIALARFDDMMTLRRLNTELEAALAQVKKLSGLLPICAACKNIRNDSGYWQCVEVYIEAHSEASFTHSICPDCTKKLYPDLFPGLFDDDDE